jgi:pimeloyl-ACP methyl ester carboxylesterase
MQIDLSWVGLTQPGMGQNYFGIDPLPPFNPDRVDFDPVNAFWLSEICRLVYRRDPDEDPDRKGLRTRHEILAQVGCEEVQFIRRQHTQCALIQSSGGRPSFAVLVFRGTTGFRNWLLDLDVRPLKLEDRAVVHRGFAEALNAVWHLLQPALARLGKPCFIAGHSMGGALAQLAATRFRPRAVYCFGAPRVGNHGFVERMRAVPIYRIVNHRDIFAMMPPASQMLLFSPAGRLVYICAQGLLRQIDDTDIAELADGSDEAPSETSQESRWYDPPRFLADHAPINYSARIGQFLQGIRADGRSDKPRVPVQLAASVDRI